MSIYFQIVTMFMVLFFIQFLYIKEMTAIKVSDDEKSKESELEPEFSCDRRMEREIDKAITKLIVVGQKNLKFPVNEQQLRPYCNLAHRTFELVAAYGEKCVPDFGRATMKVFMHIIDNELKSICKAGKLSRRARELLQAAPCANSGLKNWQGCYSQLINKFTGLMNSPIKMRIPMACCNFHQLVYCLTEEAEEVKQCTKKTVDYLTKYAHKLFDPILMILCNEYSEPSDKCDRLVKITPNRTKKQRKYYSFVRPLINIALSIVDDEELIKGLKRDQ